MVNFELCTDITPPQINSTVEFDLFSIDMKSEMILIPETRNRQRLLPNLYDQFQ